jgi:hypothetical protein
VAAYVLLQCSWFVVAALKPAFWAPQHRMAPVVVGLLLILLLLLVRRSRTAWIVLTGLQLLVVASYSWDSRYLVWLPLNLLPLLLLISPSMRAYVRPRTPRRVRLADLPRATERGL